MQTPQTLAEAQAELALELLAQGREISWIAHGQSMWPSIPSGTVVTIKPLKPEQVKCGEVGLFILPKVTGRERTSPVGSAHHSDAKQIWILHRVLKNNRRTQRIYTRGDHLPLSDTPFEYNQWVGVLKCTTAPHDQTPTQNATSTSRILRGLYRISSKVHQKNARSLNARLIGILWVNLYPIYHRLKHLISSRFPPRL